MQLETRCLLAAVGTEFQANTFSTGIQDDPAIASDSVGNFVVTWTSEGQDGSGDGVYAQRFNAAGVKQGSEFRVNSTTTGNQNSASVAMDADGDFVVIWNSEGSSTAQRGVYGQRYNSSGQSQGTEFRVSQSEIGFLSARQLDVAIDTDGDFVVTWVGRQSGTSNNAVMARRFAASGSSRGDEFRVNDLVDGQRLSAKSVAVASDAVGNFFVVWGQYPNPDAIAHGPIFGQRYSSDGTALGGNLQVSEGVGRDSAFDQDTNVDIAMDANGDTVVTWQASYRQQFGYGRYDRTYIRLVSPTGTFLTTETRVLPISGTDTYESSVSVFSDGSFVLIMSAYNQAAGFTSDDVIAQLFTSAGTRVGTPELINSQLDGSQYSVAVTAYGSSGFITAWQSGGQDNGTTGVFGQIGFPNPPPVGIALAGDEVRVNTFTTGNQSVPATAIDADGNYVVVWTSESQNSSGTSIFGRRYSATERRFGPEFQVNQLTTENQRAPQVSMDAAGNFVVVWTRQIGSGSSITFEVFARRFDASGTPITSEFRVSEPNLLIASATVAVDASGGFVIGWTSRLQNSTTYEVRLRRYSAIGTSLGSDIVVATSQPDPEGGWSVSIDSLAIDGQGVIAVLWRESHPVTPGALYLSRYSPAGQLLSQSTVFSEYYFDFGFINYGYVGSTALDVDAAGNTVVVFGEYNPGPSTTLRIRKYSSNGQFVDAAIIPSPTTSTSSVTASLLESGGVQAAWSVVEGNGDVNVYAAAFDSSLEIIGIPTIVSSTLDGNQDSPAIASNDRGQTVLAWQSAGQDGSGDGIYARTYSAVAAYIAENAGINAVVASLTTIDRSIGEPHVYSLVAGEGSADNALFNISGNQLRANASFNYEVRQNYSVRVRSTDTAGSWVERVISVAILDVIETVIEGTAADDVFRWELLAGGGVNVFLNGQLARALTTLSSVQLNAAGGNDLVQFVGTAGNDSYNYLSSNLLSFGGIQISLRNIERLELNGGGGNDEYRFDADYALLATSVTDSVGGIDTLNFEATSSALNIDLRSTAQRAITPLLQLTITAGSSIENATGGSGNDTLVGNSLGNRLIGGAGLDRLNGLEGDDALEGGEGNDSFVFDADLSLGSDTVADAQGLDTLDFSATSASRNLSVDLRSTVARVITTSLTLRLLPGSNIEQVNGGAGNDLLIGSNFNNYIAGLAGNDQIYGLAGDDVLIGGEGDDQYLFDADTQLGTDRITDTAGIDTFNFRNTTSLGIVLNLATTNATQTLNTNLKVFITASNVIENVLGSDMADNITGNGAANVLDLFGGNDVANAAGGNDLLIGGGGNDTLAGGEGNDTFQFIANSALGSDLLNESGGGVDTLDFSGTTAAIRVDLRTASAQVVTPNSTITLGNATAWENVIGGSGNDVLIGNTIDNILIGNDGNDTLYGQGGNDVLVGGAGNDVLSGEAGRDILIGGRGTDQLNGGTESDIVIGGSTTYDSNLSSLALIRTPWVFANSYGQRVASVQAGIVALNGTSIVNDAAADQLRGGTGSGDSQLDLFFVHALDTLPDWDAAVETRVLL